MRGSKNLQIMFGQLFKAERTPVISNCSLINPLILAVGGTFLTLISSRVCRQSWRGLNIVTSEMTSFGINFPSDEDSMTIMKFPSKSNAPTAAKNGASENGANANTSEDVIPQDSCSRRHTDTLSNKRFTDKAPCRPMFELEHKLQFFILA